jgi:hypothetical protein
MRETYDSLLPHLRELLMRRRPELLPHELAKKVHGVVLGEYICPGCNRVYEESDWVSGCKRCPDCMRPLPVVCIQCHTAVIEPFRSRDDSAWYSAAPQCPACVETERMGHRLDQLAESFPRYALELAHQDNWIPPFRGRTKTRFAHRSDLCHMLRTWQEDWGNGNRYSLWISGNVGPGKTVAVIRYVAEVYVKGGLQSMAYITEDDLCDHASGIGTDDRKRAAYAYRDNACKAELLVFDECNSRGGIKGGRRAHLSDVQERWIIAVAKARLDHGLATIFISNADSPENWESLRDPRCRSRLLGAVKGHSITCNGPDMRVA